MILVVGATGLLGGRIVSVLAEQGVPVRALVRPKTDAAALETAGIEVVRGDLGDPPSLDRALSGVDTVVTTANAMARSLAGDSSVTIHAVDEVGNANLIDAAARAGVDRFVYISIDRSGLAVHTPFTDAKRVTEERLARAPMASVVVRPESFQEVWLSPVVGFDLEHGSVRVYGEGRTAKPYVSIDDIAVAVARVATMPTPPREIALAGPEAMSEMDLVDRWQKLTGRRLKVQHIPRIAMAIGSRLMRPFRPTLASIMGMALWGDTTKPTATDVDFRALGIEPRPVSAYLGTLAKAGQPH